MDETQFGRGPTKVWACVSGMDTQRDVSSEVFYLEPVASA